MRGSRYRWVPCRLTQRESNRQDVFLVGDPRVFSELLRESAAQYGLGIHGYCPMVNRVNLVIAPRRPGSVAKALGRAPFTYTAYANRRHGLSGRLWGTRGQRPESA